MVFDLNSQLKGGLLDKPQGKGIHTLISVYLAAARRWFLTWIVNSRVGSRISPRAREYIH